ncbi:hypothetical protein ACERZ8_04130 [Tateyamaria armeniaca]|uniref:Uncharacterized protein n=1 Tax=Tateyamaria armeniaca TaxID=2518930 RepID=A0ABW8UPP4_9RHOB
MRWVALTFALIAPQIGLAQDQAAFEAALAECARYVVAQPEADWNFQTAPASVDQDEGGTDASVVYPAGSGGNFDFAVSYSHTKGTSTTPGTWSCAGVGPKSPQWPQFTVTGWIGADARLRAAGLVELKFPPPQRAYANCTAEAADVYVLFNAGEGDRVVFAATTGPTAAAFCSSMGWKG